MAYVYNKNYVQKRIKSKLSYQLIENDCVVKLSLDEFNAIRKKFASKLEDIVNMATRIKKQFNNAALTSDGKLLKHKAFLRR